MVRLAVAVAAGVACVLTAGACRSPSAGDHAPRAQVLAYLRREGVYQPATTRVRATEWRPETREWLVDLEERHENPRWMEQTNLTVNAAATAYRDDTCRM